MRDQSCFQDWNTVTLTKEPSSSSNKPPHTVSSNKKDGNDIENPMKVTTELRIAIQQARLSNKLSQKQLASIMCCQSTLINQYESGKVTPNNAFISKLEQKLKTKLPRIKK